MLGLLAWLPAARLGATTAGLGIQGLEPCQTTAWRAALFVHSGAGLCLEAGGTAVPTRAIFSTQLGAHGTHALWFVLPPVR